MISCVLHIKHALFIILLITSPIIGVAQTELTSNVLRPYVHDIEVSDGKIVGKGRDILVEKIQQVQFIALGENHNSYQLAGLVNALLPILSENGFGFFAIENGPYAARTLMELSAEPLKTTSQLGRLNKMYNFPIPFFKGIEDAQFLATASASNFQLWGLDQEATSLYLLDKIAEKITNVDLQHVMGEARTRLIELSKNPKTNCACLKDEALVEFFDQVQDTESRNIIDAIQKSWEIYCLYEEGKYNESNEKRVTYMRSNFSEYYRQAKMNKNEPKIFIKMGHVHVARGKSQYGLDDIGDTIEKLAKTNETKSLHIAQRQRFWKTKFGITVDLMRHSDNIAPLLSLAEKDSWTMVDLAAFREESTKYAMSREMSNEINRYDLILIAPSDRFVRKNRGKGK